MMARSRELLAVKCQAVPNLPPSSSQQGIQADGRGFCPATCCAAWNQVTKETPTEAKTIKCVQTFTVQSRVKSTLWWSQQHNTPIGNNMTSGRVSTWHCMFLHSLRFWPQFDFGVSSSFSVPHDKTSGVCVNLTVPPDKCQGCQGSNQKFHPNKPIRSEFSSWKFLLARDLKAPLQGHLCGQTSTPLESSTLITVPPCHFLSFLLSKLVENSEIIREKIAIFFHQWFLLRKKTRLQTQVSSVNMLIQTIHTFSG